jgi:uncharacterized protein DUF4440
VRLQLAAVGILIATGAWAQSSGPDAGRPTEPAPVPVVSPPSQSAAAADVIALERKIGDAIVRGDAAFFDSVTSDDFVMIHGDGWTKGGKPALVDDKASFMKRIASKAYAAHDFDAEAVEMHGDVAITYGRYVGNIPGSPPGRQWFNVWYQKVYARRAGRWMYLSHRTVNGANYGLDRQSVTAR